MFSSIKVKVHLVTGPIPIAALTCPDTTELAGARSLRRSRHGSTHSYGYGFMAGVLPATPAGPCALRAHVQNRSGRFCQSSPAFSRIWPAPECRITSLAILWCGIPMQSAG
jgi:hypothetical protein